MGSKQTVSKVWQMPIIYDRDMKDIIGLVTIDVTRLPKGTDWALQLGLNQNKQIILFSTYTKISHRLVEKEAHET